MRRRVVKGNEGGSIEIRIWRKERRKVSEISRRRVIRVEVFRVPDLGVNAFGLLRHFGHLAECNDFIRNLHVNKFGRRSRSCLRSV